MTHGITGKRQRMRKILLLVLLFITFIVFVRIAYGADDQTKFNPFTGKMDWIRSDEWRLWERDSGMLQPLSISDDISLSDMVYIDSSEKYLGINTETPEHNVHVKEIETLTMSGFTRIEIAPNLELSGGVSLSSVLSASVDTVVYRLYVADDGTVYKRAESGV